MNQLAGKIVLVVDDEPDIREILGDALSLEGAEVRSCDNGREGYLMSVELKPDIILSDGLMPEMNGLDLLSRVKESGQSCVRVLISTFGENLEEEAIRREIDAVFLKPFQIASIVSFLARAVHQTNRPKRRTLRLRYRVSLKALFHPHHEAISTYTNNIGNGGLFVELLNGSLPSHGTEVEFEIFLDGQSTRGKGICRWTRPDNDYQSPRGFGVQFTSPHPELMELIEDLGRVSKEVDL